MHSLYAARLIEDRVWTQSLHRAYNACSLRTPSQEEASRVSPVEEKRTLVTPSAGAPLRGSPRPAIHYRAPSMGALRWWVMCAGCDASLCQLSAHCSNASAAAQGCESPLSSRLRDQAAA